MATKPSDKTPSYIYRLRTRFIADHKDLDCVCDSILDKAPGVLCWGCKAREMGAARGSRE